MLTQTFLWLLIVAQMSGDGKYATTVKLAHQALAARKQLVLTKPPASNQR